MKEDLSFVEGIITLLREQHPDLTPEDVEAFRRAICEHYGGERHWIPNGSDGDQLIARVKGMLGLYSEREIARRLGVGKMTVNRIKNRLLQMRRPPHVVP